MQKTHLDWADVAEPTAGKACTRVSDGRANWPRGKCLGGSSVLGNGVYIRGDSRDYDSWSSIVSSPEWDWNHVSKVFKKLEGCYRICNEGIDFEERGMDGPVSIDFKYPRNPLAERFVLAAGTMEFEVVDYNQGCLENSVSLVQSNIQDGAKCTAADAYIWSVLGSRRNLNVVLNAEVQRILTDTSVKTPVAYGVEFQYSGTAKLHTVRARKEVIISSSAIGTPKLLMLSGIGPREELSRFGIPCVAHSPSVGSYLMDHIVLPVFVRVKSKRPIGSINYQNSQSFFTVAGLSSMFWWLYSGIGTLASSSYDAVMFYSTGLSENIPFPDIKLGIQCSCGTFAQWTKNFGYNIDGYLTPQDVSDSAQGFVMMPTLLHPFSTGSVKLGGRSMKDRVAIKAGYFDDERDLKMLASGAITAVQVAKKMGFEDIVVPQDLRSYELDSIELWMEMARRYATTGHSPSSTCRMGSVLDAELKVKGVTGLRVADASAFPHVTSGDGNAPAMLVGEMLSNFLKRQYQLSA